MCLKVLLHNWISCVAPGWGQGGLRAAWDSDTNISRFCRLCSLITPPPPDSSPWRQSSNRKRYYASQWGNDNIAWNCHSIIRGSESVEKETEFALSPFIFSAPNAKNYNLHLDKTLQCFSKLLSSDVFWYIQRSGSWMSGFQKVITQRGMTWQVKTVLAQL